MLQPPSPLFFFFNDTATTEIYTLSLHDALPIFGGGFGGFPGQFQGQFPGQCQFQGQFPGQFPDQKSTRLNSSHLVISYAVFCLKKKKELTLLHSVVCASTYNLLSHLETHWNTVN